MTQFGALSGPLRGADSCPRFSFTGGDGERDGEAVIQEGTDGTSIAEVENALFHQLVYVSSATRAIEDDDLKQILASARGNNAALGITGMLLFYDGCFIQVLEGEQQVIEALFHKIEKDERHDRTVVLYRGEADERLFAEWTMGFRHASAEECRQLDGLNDFLRTGDTRCMTSLTKSKASDILIGFRDGRWHR